MRDDILAFYRSLGPFSSLGTHAHLAAALPVDVAKLCAVVQGLVLHAADPGFAPPPAVLA